MASKAEAPKLDRARTQVAVRVKGQRGVRTFPSIDAAGREFGWTYGSSLLKKIRREVKAGYTVESEIDGTTYIFSAAE